jgi:hypothetical protein
LLISSNLAGFPSGIYAEGGISGVGDHLPGYQFKVLVLGAIIPILSDESTLRKGSSQGEVGHIDAIRSRHSINYCAS